MTTTTTTTQQTQPSNTQPSNTPPSNTPTSLYTYRAKIVKVHDGDTLTVDIDLGFGVMLTDQQVRLKGINAPELETPAGKDSLLWLTSYLNKLPKDVMIVTFKDKTEKYGRLLGDIWINDIKLNDVLVSNNKAFVWDGRGVKPVSAAS